MSLTENSSNYKLARRICFWFGIILGVLLICLIIAVIILSLVPPTTKDELVHHLAVPKLYLQHGSIYEISFMDYSYYPMNLDLLYMIPLYFGNDIIPKFIHFTFALLTAWLIFYYLKRRTSPIYALFGVIFFLSIPVIIKLSITAYIDLGEIFFSFAALLLIMQWMKRDFKLKYLIYSGIACGLALGTKYNGLVTLAILALFVPFIYSRYSNEKVSGSIRPIVYGAIFVFVSLLFFSPWMIRDYKWKGNPIYPLYNQIFNPPKEVVKSAFSQISKEKRNSGFFTERSMNYKETGWQIAMLPVRIFFQGKDGEPQYFDGKLNPFLLILPLFAFYRLKDEPNDIRREKKILLAFSTIFFFFAFFSSSLRIRYISPFIPPLIVLSVFGLMNLFKMVQRISSLVARKISVFLVVLIPCSAIALNSNYIVGQFETVNPVPFITGKISRDEYIEKYVPEYPTLRYINNNLDHKAKILFIYTGKRGYYCDREYLLDEGMGILKSSVAKANTPEDILKDLKQKGITHMLVNYRLFERWMDNNFSEEKRALTQSFFKEQLVLLYGENGFGISVLK
jgi:4-amino-4-deoxy-L-arabinose transferase-like glycosyltransferase